MKILALQLKRIGDLVLTTPALSALKAAAANNELVLAVHSSTAGLLPAIADVDSTIVFGARRGWTPWQQVLTGGFDVVLDFTGTDRSALATFIARAHRTITFEWVRKKRLRSLPYSEFIPSSVRERHTTDHYLDLAASIGPAPATAANAQPHLRQLSSPFTGGPYAVLHPGTARVEKNWLNERWEAVARHLLEGHACDIIITTGPDPVEKASAEALHAAIRSSRTHLVQPPNLCEFAALLAGAEIVVSCDTAAVHLAAAFQRPQIALFGPTNPFHWRPQHERGVVISAARPDSPLASFEPRMKGAPMDRISTEVVCRAIDQLHVSPSSPLSTP